MKNFIAICAFILYTCVVLWEGYNYGHNKKVSISPQICKVVSVKEKCDNNCKTIVAELSEKIRLTKIQKEQCEDELEECELQQ